MKKFFKWVLIIIVGIVVINIATGGDEETATPAPAGETKEAAAEPAKKESKAVGIGTKAEVANVGFTATGVNETNVIESGNDYIEDAKTEGKYIIVDLKVDNGQKKALTINSSFFKIKVNGAEYEPITDGSVIMAMGDAGTDFFLQQINPGLSKSGKIVFEVPADVKAADALLHCQTGAFGTETTEIKLAK
jgi:Domain of unknown function (DUF4352)